MSNHGRCNRDPYRHEMLGGNHRLDALQAAVLSVKLPHLDAWNAARRSIAAAYLRALDRADVELPASTDDVEHVWHLFPILHPRRDELRTALERSGIGAGVHYPIPV